MKYTLYTTASSDWYRKKCIKIAERLSNTKGRGEVSFEIIEIEPPQLISLVKDNQGHVRFDWNWFGFNFPTNRTSGAFFHFTPSYKRKWGISPEINGSRNSDNKDYPEFWLCCAQEKADGYADLSNFERLIYHELGHFDEDLDDDKGDLLPQDSVHTWDYDLKQIHNFHILVDYRAQSLKEKIRQLFISMIDYATQIIQTRSK